VINTLFEAYRPFVGDIGKTSNGSLLATESGISNPFGLSNAEERGMLFIPPGTEVYEGMIVGKHQRDTDLEVNVCKMKALSNMRSSNSDIGIRLTTPTEMSLDRAIEYIGPDELVEVTPRSIRMRKRILDTTMRKRTERNLAAAR
jgi:GTP-binding protein